MSSLSGLKGDDNLQPAIVSAGWKPTRASCVFPDPCLHVVTLQGSGSLGIDVGLNQPLGMGSQPMRSMQEELGVDMSGMQVPTKQPSLPSVSVAKQANCRTSMCMLAYGQPHDWVALCAGHGAGRPQRVGLVVARCAARRRRQPAGQSGAGFVHTWQPVAAPLGAGQPGAEPVARRQPAGAAACAAAGNGSSGGARRRPEGGPKPPGRGQPPERSSCICSRNTRHGPDLVQCRYCNLS